MAINKIIYKGITYDKLRSGNCYLVTSLPFSELESNTLTVVIESNNVNLLDFNRGEPLIYYYRDKQIGVFYVQDIQRIASNQFKLYATSAIGILSEDKHYGGIYTGQTVIEVIDDICGSVPHIIKNGLQNIKLYGWLPVASPRENLAQVLFAIGATITTDLYGVLRIEGLWDGISGYTGPNRLCIGAKVTYTSKVTSVSVTEHQFLATQGEETTLFEGVSQDGDFITFQSPIYDLQAEGFTILESNANFAKISAGSGTLKGKKYIHNTRTLVKEIYKSDSPNIKSVNEVTLVSIVNSVAVLDRMAKYYEYTQTIEASTIYHGEQTGDRRLLFNPYDEIIVDACLKSIDINMSNTLKAQEKSIVGYKPPQSGVIEYFDECEVLTGSGVWTPPSGVEVATVVLIGKGLDGASGNAGADSSDNSCIVTSNNAVHGGSWSSPPRSGGEGGEGGDGGQGGKIYRKTIEIRVKKVATVVRVVHHR